MSDYKVKNLKGTPIDYSNKNNWAHFWEVRGRVLIGNKDHTYTFSVYQKQGETTAAIYDFKLKRKK